MDVNLTPQQILLLSILAALLGGMLLAWLILRARWMREEARLNAALQAAEAEIGEQIALREQSETQRQQVQDQLQQAQIERAAWQERSAIIPRLHDELTHLRQQFEHSQQDLRRYAEQHAALNTALEELRPRLALREHELQTISAQLAEYQQQLAETRTQLAAEREQAAEKLRLLLEAKSQLGEQFKLLASEILEEKTHRFSEHNQQQLGQLLNPLRERLGEFQKKVEDSYGQEARERHALREELKRLAEMNSKLGHEAENLTRALKGERKTQGVWGEMILDTVLESSGLRKGHEYATQVSLAHGAGRVQPDALIYLPDNRVVIVDAKVSLSAYERYVNADDQDARARNLKEHISALRAHIAGLADKAYENIPQLRTLDFVILFVPIEPALMLAMQHDASLFQDALKRNIVLVSPTTLLAVLRTIAHVWRQEQQNQNAQEIARQAGDLYDKLVGFVEDMQTLGNRLEQAEKSYQTAFSKLYQGRGNLIGRAQRLHKLGVQPSKSVSDHLLHTALEHDEDPA